jgi:alkylation response protein AidB-like acyl-CoA dehydrogenase
MQSAISGATLTTFDFFQTSEEHEELRSVVRSLAENKIAPFAAQVDEDARFPQEAYDALRAAELQAIHVPEAYGGAQGDALAYAIVVEEVARACASSSLIPGVNKLASLPVIMSGSEELKREFLPGLASGETLWSYALSETDAGSDAGSMKTTADATGDSWTLNGSKKWITNAGESEIYTVLAVTDKDKGTRGGITAFVVKKDDVGVSFGAPEKKLGIKGSPTREVYLDNVVIPDTRRIGEVGSGFSIAMNTLDHSRIAIAAQAVGIAQGALDFAAGYIKERKQFGKAIADFQGIQFMVADMAMKLEAARQLTYAAAARSERGDANLTFFGAASKCFASDVAMEITTDAVQLLGGYGYSRDYPVERMMRDAKITQIYEGTNQVQRIVMSRHTLASR